MADEGQTPDPAAVDYVPDLAPAGPVTTTTTGGDVATSGTTRELPGPATTQALGDMDAAAQAEANAQRQVGDAQAQASGALADNQHGDAELAQQHYDRAVAEDAARQERIARATALADKASTDVQGLDYHQLFPTRGKSLHGLLSLGLAAGSGNPAMVSAIQGQIDGETRAESDGAKQAMDLAFEKRKAAGEDVNQLYSQWEHANGLQAALEAQGHQVIAAKRVEMLTRMGIPVDKAKNDVIVQQQLGKSAEKKLEAVRAFDRHSQSEVHRQLTPSVSEVSGRTAPVSPEQRQHAEEFQQSRDISGKLPADKPVSDPVKRIVRMSFDEGTKEGVNWWDRLKTYKASPKDKEQAEALGELVRSHAHDPNNKQSFDASLEMMSEPQARKRAMNVQAAGVGMKPAPKAPAPVAPVAPVAPPPQGQLKKVRNKAGVRGYLTPAGKFIPEPSRG